MIDRLRPRTMHVRTTTQAVEMARSFSEEEWSRLQKRITDTRPFYLMAVGGVLMGYGMVGNSMDLIYHIPVLILGNLIFFSSFVFIPAAKKDNDFLRKVIKFELKEDEKILPEDLTIKYYTSIPMREPPDLSPTEWKSLMRKYKLSRIYIFLPLVLSISAMIPLPVFLADMFSLNIYLILPFVPLLVLPAVYLLIVAVYAGDKVKAMIKYEELSGEKIIPEDHREAVERSVL